MVEKKRTEQKEIDLSYYKEGRVIMEEEFEVGAKNQRSSKEMRNILLISCEVPSLIRFYLIGLMKMNAHTARH